MNYGLIFLQRCIIKFNRKFDNLLGVPSLTLNAEKKVKHRLKNLIIAYFPKQVTYKYRSLV